MKSNPARWACFAYDSHWWVTALFLLQTGRFFSAVFPSPSPVPRGQSNDQQLCGGLAITAQGLCSILNGRGLRVLVWGLLQGLVGVSWDHSSGQRNWWAGIVSHPRNISLLPMLVLDPCSACSALSQMEFAAPAWESKALALPRRAQDAKLGQSFASKC